MLVDIVARKEHLLGTDSVSCTSNWHWGGRHMMRLRATSVLLILVFAFAASVSAHHSVQAVFDIHHTVTVSGTVAKVEWINPHSYLTVDVKSTDGKVQKWAFELG